MERTPWYEGLEPVVSTIDCGRERHTVRWEAGELLVDDHDLEAEEVLRVLSGETVSLDTPACIDIVRAWRMTPQRPRLQERLGRCLELSGSPKFEEERAWAEATSPPARPTPPPAALADETFRAQFEVVGESYGLGRGIWRSSPDLRLVLATEIAWRWEPVTDDSPSSRFRSYLGQSSAAVRAHISLCADLADGLGPDSPLAVWPSKGVRGGPVREPGVVFQPGSVTAPAVTIVTSSDVASIDCVVGPAPSAAVVFDGERVTGRLSLASSWMARVLGRGLCGEHLVLDVTEESADGRSLEVIAGRWEREADGRRVHPHPAAMTWDGRWQFRWSGA